MSTLLHALWTEHRTIASILDLLAELASDERGASGEIDTRIFRAAFHYLDRFPERMHHPKEEQYLFTAIRAKTADADDALAALSTDHQGGAQAIRDLEASLTRCEDSKFAEWPSFAKMLGDYVAGYRAHMRMEEQVIMPLARRVLGPEDWDVIEARWAENDDPLKGAAENRDYDRLIGRMMELAPPPYGFGEPA